MKTLLAPIQAIVLCCVLIACNSNKTPDVRNVAVEVQTLRFERDFFDIETSNIDKSMQLLHNKYPGFLQDFLFNILALPAQPDSLPAVKNGVERFVQSYQPVKDSANIIFSNFSPITAEIINGLKHVKYYFPEYGLPRKIITFIGPIDSYGNIITADGLAIGLQLFMGKNYSLYQSEAGQQLYPLYISRRFEAAYIPVSCIKNIVSDFYPDNNVSKPLVEQMIEAGKRLYVLDKLLPQTSDTLKTGYTENQLAGCYKNEAFIWSFFVQNDLLFSADPAMTKDYMTDGPKTAVLGESAPGFIGQFVGWQIVKKWMDEKDNATLKALLATNAKTIYEEAKYKPR